MSTNQDRSRSLQHLAVYLGNLVLGNLVLVACLAVWNPAAAQPPVEPSHQTVTIPLRDGKLSLKELAAVLARTVGSEAPAGDAGNNAQIDVDKPAGRITLRLITHATRGVVTFEKNDSELIVQIDNAQWGREEQRVRTSLRLLVESWFPQAAIQAEAAFGVRVHTAEGTAVLPDPSNLTPDVVVLVHGLDDPGKVWNVLAPMLVREGFTACEFTYPNDQQISNSAELLDQHLVQLKELGVHRVTLIAHSMGGLVSRETLTNPLYYAGRGIGHATRPDVTRLILVGTPNHGSAMVRLRFIGEVREQVERMFAGNLGILTGILDGAGEAKVDLLPGSEFLTTLNARQLPKDVECTIVAGKLSPITKETVARFEAWVNFLGPQSLRDELRETFAALAEQTDGVSDGLVTIESTRLPGVDDHVVVEGNHLTMIRNLISISNRIPPAVPVILRRLKAPSSNVGVARPPR